MSAMCRFVIVAGVLVAALGCGRNEKAASNPSDPSVMLGGPDAVKETPVPPPPQEVPGASRLPALKLGVEYLMAHQKKDGAWRSDVYATFKDGTALTPLVVVALQEASDAGVRKDGLDATIKKGCDYLAKFVKDDVVTAQADGFDYPIYTASLTLKAFSHPTAEDHALHRTAWVKYLKDRQLTEKLGWKPEEKQYGGWGYCRVIPQKPEPGKFAPNLIESNLSATVFALDALKTAGALDADTAKAAAIFVRTCQNWRPPVPGAPPPWSRYLDGGFHFIYDDPTRNKAGMVPKAGADWPQLFYSYGSTTADGLQALALCNDPADEARREAARKWLLVNFSAEHHPGTYIKTHERNRNAVYFYYAASVARAFRDQRLKLPNDRDWSAELSVELARRQSKDGSWANFDELDLVRENDPIVATSDAMLALARCK
jgi:hypothetical protein